MDGGLLRVLHCTDFGLGGRIGGVVQSVYGGFYGFYALGNYQFGVWPVGIDQLCEISTKGTVRKSMTKSADFSGSRPFFCQNVHLGVWHVF